MEYIAFASKIIIFVSIINVWFFRFNKPTQWRAGDSGSMKAEFEAYGLSEPIMYLVGGLKILSATLLVVSIWIPILAMPAALVMMVLMMGAISMHVKVNDPLKKSIPAFVFLILSLYILADIYGIF